MYLPKAASEAACNWCGPAALADADPGPEALCTRHQAAYFERRAADAAASDEAWWSGVLAEALQSGPLEGLI